VAWPARAARKALTPAVWTAAIIIVVTTLLRRDLTLPQGIRWNDSYVYLNAASGFIGHPGHLYDAARLQLTRPWAQRAFIYPPSALLAFLPLLPILHVMGLHAAAATWTLLDTAALIAALILFGRRAGVGWLVLGASLLVISLSQPFGWEVFSGQVNGMILLCVCLAGLLPAGRRSGALLGIAIACKPAAAFALLVPLLRRQSRVVAVALMTFVVANAVLLPFIGLDSALFYAGAVLPFLVAFVIHDPHNMSLPNLLQGWFGGGVLPKRSDFATAVPRGLPSLLMLWAGRLAAVAATARVAIDSRVSDAAAMALAIGLVPLLGATVWPHYLVYVFPLALVALRSELRWARYVGAASLLAMCWPAEVDGLWLGLTMLWMTAAAVLLRDVGFNPTVTATRAGRFVATSVLAVRIDD
jgi:Glycosyltransferase family 87